MQLTAEILADLLAALRSDAPSGAENRKQPRVGFSGQVEIIMPGKSEPCLTRVRDISQDGIGLLTHVPLKAGDEIVLLLGSRETGPKFVRCAVRHCRKVAANLYNVGVRLMDGSGANAG